MKYDAEACKTMFALADWLPCSESTVGFTERVQAGMILCFDSCRSLQTSAALKLS